MGWICLWVVERRQRCGTSGPPSQLRRNRRIELVAKIEAAIEADDFDGGGGEDIADSDLDEVTSRFTFAFGATCSIALGLGCILQGMCRRLIVNSGVDEVCAAHSRGMKE